MKDYHTICKEMNAQVLKYAFKGVKLGAFLNKPYPHPLKLLDTHNA
jgi:hypothetical protein